MTGRLDCCVPFCRRWTTKWPNASEWICATHYRLADKTLRRRRTTVMARLRSLDEMRRAHRIDGAFWRKIKRQAITRAGATPL